MSPARSADDNGPRAEDDAEADAAIVGGFARALAALAQGVLAAEGPRRARLERALATIAGPVALLAVTCDSAPSGAPLPEKSEKAPLPEKSEKAPLPEKPEKFERASGRETAPVSGHHGGSSCCCGGRASRSANYYDPIGFYNEATDPVAIHFAAAAAGEE